VRSDNCGTVTSDAHLTICTYYCDDGYTIVSGDVVRVCNGDYAKVGWTAGQYNGSDVVCSPPTVTNFQPAYGPAGIEITITGTNFASPYGNAVTTASLGAFNMTGVTVVSATTITGTVPAGLDASTTYSLSVNIKSSATASFSSFTFSTYTISDYWTISSGSPDRYGPAQGGTRVTITGVNFDTGSTPTVNFGSMGATVASTSSTQIVVTTPAVTVPSNTVNQTICVRYANIAFGGVTCLPIATDFIFYNTTLASVYPVSGPVGGGTNLTLNGYFHPTRDLDVRINGASASCARESTALIICTTSAQTAGSVNVDVSMDSSTSTASLKYSNTIPFDYYAEPTVSSIFPSIGFTTGSLVTLTGSGFVDYNIGLSLVALGNTAATTIQELTSTKIIARLPSCSDTGSAQTVSILLNGQQAATSTTSFYCMNDVTISSVSPQLQPARGGMNLTFTGSYSSGGGSSSFTSLASYAEELRILDRHTSEYLPVTIIDGSNLLIQTSSISRTTGQWQAYSFSPNGNETSSSTTWVFSYPSPVVSSLNPVSGPSTGNTNVTVTGTFYDTHVAAGTFNSGAAASCHIVRTSCVDFGTPNSAGSTQPTCTDVKCVSPSSVTTGALEISNDDISVLSTAAVYSSDSVTFTSYSPPSVSALDPPLGPTTGSTQVTVTGSGFVSVGDSPLATISKTGLSLTVSATRVDSTTMTLTTPSSGLTDGEFSIEILLNGQQATSNAIKYQSYPDPTLTSVSPMFFPVRGSTNLTLSGSGFAILNSGSAIINSNYIRVAAASQVWETTAYELTGQLVTDTELRVVTTAHIEDEIALQVSLNAQQYHAVPGISVGVYPEVQVYSISPKSGPFSGDTTVTVEGGFYNTSRYLAEFGSQQVTCSNYQQSTTFCGAEGDNCTCVDGRVRYGLAASSDFSRWVRVNTSISCTHSLFTLNANGANGGSITNGNCYCWKAQFDCVSPTAASATASTLKASIDPSAASAQQFSAGTLYTYYDINTTSLDPPLGPISGGTSVTISGLNFVDYGDILKVKVNSSVLDANVTISGGNMIATIPASAGAGTTSLEVSLNGQQFTQDSIAYTYYNDPTFSSVSPQLFPVRGETVVTISGSGFDVKNERTNGYIGGSFLRVAAATQVWETSAYEIVADHVSNSEIRFNATAHIEDELTLKVSLNAQQYVHVPGIAVGVYPEVQLYSIFPKSGPVSGDTTVAVKGGFYNTSRYLGEFGEGANQTQVTCSNFQQSVTLCGAEGGNCTCVDGRVRYGLQASSDYSRWVRVNTSISCTHSLFTLNSNGANGGSITSGNCYCWKTQIDCLAPSAVGGPGASALRTGIDPASVSTEQKTHRALYTYYRVNVTRLDPPLGPVEGGTSLTVHGVDFLDYADPLKVKINNTIVDTGVAFDSGGAFLTVNTPGETNGHVPIEISLNGQQFTSDGVSFLYYTRNAYTINPTFAPFHGGTNLYLTPQSSTTFANGSLHLRCDYSGASLATGYLQSDGRILCTTAAFTNVAPSDNSPHVTKLNLTLNGQQFSFDGDSPSIQFYDPPRIESITPLSGPTTGNTSVTLTGYFFATGWLRVNFSGTIVNCTRQSDVSAVCVSPQGPVSNSALGVSVDDPTDNSIIDYQYNASVTFRYYSTPNVTYLDPPIGPTTGSTVVTLSGQGFVLTGDSFQVYFDGEAATAVEGFTVGGVVKFRATSPIGVREGLVQLAMNGQQIGTSAVNFTSYVNPNITSFVPLFGPISGGTQMTISGVNFLNFSRVTHPNYVRCRLGSNIVNGTIFPSDAGSGFRIYCETPSGSDGNTTLGISLDAQNFVDFTLRPFNYYSQVVVTAQMPFSGPVSGNTSVKIYGVYRQTTNVAAKFGSIPALECSYQSDHILCISPPTNATGKVLVTVSVEDRSRNLKTTYNGTRDFEYYSLPNVTKVEPPLGPFGGDTLVTVSGANISDFGDQIVVRFGSVFANATYIGNGAVTVTTPQDLTGTAGAQCANFTICSPVTVYPQVLLNGQQASSYGVPFVRYSHPDLTVLSDPYGPVRGNMRVYMNGTGLHNISGGTHVRVRTEYTNGTVISTVTASLLSDVALTYTTSSIPGPANVSLRVSLNAQQYTPTYVWYNYYAHPSITELIPHSGPHTGDTRVRVIGSGFYPTRGIHGHFGAYDSACSYVSLTELLCVSPARNETITAPVVEAVNVTLDTSLNGMRNYVLSDMRFMYYEPPTLRFASPELAIANSSGLSVAVVGQNLTDTILNGVQEVSLAVGGVASPNTHSPQYKLIANITNRLDTALVQFPVAIPLDTETMISNGHLKSDCSDLQVYTLDLRTTFDLWFEDGSCGTPNAYLWLRISLAAREQVSLALYHGDNNLTTAYDPGNVFDVIDDFSAQNLTFWSYIQPVNVSESEANYVSGNLVFSSASMNGRVATRTEFTMPASTRIDFRVLRTISSNQFIYFSSTRGETLDYTALGTKVWYLNGTEACAGGICTHCGLNVDKFTIQIDSSYGATVNGYARNGTAYCGPLSTTIPSAAAFYVFIGSLSSNGSFNFISARPLYSLEPLVELSSSNKEMELILADTPNGFGTGSNYNLTVALNGQQYDSLGTLTIQTYETPTVYHLSPSTGFADEETLMTMYTTYINRSSIYVRISVSTTVHKYATATRVNNTDTLPNTAARGAYNYSVFQFQLPNLLENGRQVATGGLNIEVSLNGRQYASAPGAANFTVNLIDTCNVISDDFQSNIRSYQFSQSTGSLGTYCISSATGAASGSTESLEFSNSGTRVLTTNPMDTTLGGYIEFYFRYGGQSSDPTQCSGPIGSSIKSMLLQYTHDDITWTTMETLSSTGASATWSYHSVTLPVLAQSSYTAFRWYQADDGSNDRGTYAIDELHVRISPRTSGLGITVTDFAPKSGPITGNTTLHVYGTNFSASHVPTCLFGGASGNASSDATYINSSLIICKTPQVAVSRAIAVHVCGAVTTTTQTFFFYEEPASLASSVTAIPQIQSVGASAIQYKLRGTHLFESSEVKVRYTETTGTRNFVQEATGASTSVSELLSDNALVTTSTLGEGYPLGGLTHWLFQAQYGYDELQKRGFCTGTTSCTHTTASTLQVYIDSVPEQMPDTFTIKYLTATSGVLASLSSSSRKMTYSDTTVFTQIYAASGSGVTLTQGWNSFALSANIDFTDVVSSSWYLIIQFEGTNTAEFNSTGHFGYRQSLGENAVKTYTTATTNYLSTTYPWDNIDSESIVPRIALCSSSTTCGQEWNVEISAPVLDNTAVESGDQLKIEVAMNGQQYSPNSATLTVYGPFTGLSITPRVAPTWGQTQVTIAAGNLYGLSPVVRLAPKTLNAGPYVYFTCTCVDAPTCADAGATCTTPTYDIGTDANREIYFEISLDGENFASDGKFVFGIFKRPYITDAFFPSRVQRTIGLEAGGIALHVTGQNFYGYNFTTSEAYCLFAYKSEDPADSGTTVATTVVDRTFTIGTYTTTGVTVLEDGSDNCIGDTCYQIMARSKATVTSTTELVCLAPARPTGFAYQVYITFNGVTSNIVSNYFATSQAAESTITITTTACTAGQYASYYYLNCTDCPVGTFSDAAGARVCSECQAGLYQDQTGQAACLTCPDLSTTQMDYPWSSLVQADLGTQLNPDAATLVTGASSIENCTCQPGAYYDQAKTCDLAGTPYTNPCCSACPAGGVCPGGNYDGQPIVPYPDTGYYRLEDGTTILFFECSPLEACNGGIDKNSWCSSKYRGNKCAQCARNHFRDGAMCTKCPPTDVSLLVFLGLLSIVFLYGFFKFAPYLKGLGSTRIFFNFVSASASFNHFSITWPPAVVDFYNSLSFISINIDFANPECQVDIPYLYSFLLMEMIPFALLAILFGIFGVIWLNARCKLMRQKKLTNDVAKVKSERKCWEKLLDSIWLKYTLYVCISLISIPRFLFMVMFVVFLFMFICVVRFVTIVAKAGEKCFKGIQEAFAPAKHFDDEQDDLGAGGKLHSKSNGVRVSAFDRAYAKLDQQIHIGRNNSMWAAFLQCQEDEDLYVHGRAATQEEQRRMYQNKGDTDDDGFAVEERRQNFLKSRMITQAGLDLDFQKHRIQERKQFSSATRHSGGVMWMYSPQFHKFMVNNFMLTNDGDSELFKNLSNQILEMFEKQNVDSGDDDTNSLKRHIRNSWNMTINAICMVLLFTHLVLVGTALEVFVCTKAVGNKSYLQADQEIVCWESQHMTLVGFALIFLLVWGVGIPLTLYLLVLCDAKLGLEGLYHPNNKSKYGYIYLKYANQFWYWEFVVLFRKFLLETCRVLFSLEDTKFIQVTGAFLIFCFATFAQFYLNPFVERELNDIESSALWNHIVVLFIGTVFLTEQLPVDGSLATFIAFVVILLILVTGCYIFKSVWIELHDTVPFIGTILQFSYVSHTWQNELKHLRRANAWISEAIDTKNCKKGGCCSVEEDESGHLGECCCCLRWCKKKEDHGELASISPRSKINYLKRVYKTKAALEIDNLQQHPEMDQSPEDDKGRDDKRPSSPKKNETKEMEKLAGLNPLENSPTAKSSGHKQVSFNLGSADKKHGEEEKDKEGEEKDKEGEEKKEEKDSESKAEPDEKTVEKEETAKDDESAEVGTSNGKESAKDEEESTDKAEKNDNDEDADTEAKGTDEPKEESETEKKKEKTTESSSNLMGAFMSMITGSSSNTKKDEEDRDDKKEDKEEDKKDDKKSGGHETGEVDNKHGDRNDGIDSKHAPTTTGDGGDVKLPLIKIDSISESRGVIGDQAAIHHVDEENEFDTGATVNLEEEKRKKEREDLAKISIRRSMTRAQNHVRTMVSQSPILSDLGGFFANAWIDDPNTPMRDKIQFATRIHKMCMHCFEQLLGVSRAHLSGVPFNHVGNCKRKRIFEFMQQADLAVMSKFRVPPLIFIQFSQQRSSQGFVTLDGWGGKKRGGLVMYEVSTDAKGLKIMETGRTRYCQNRNGIRGKDVEGEGKIKQTASIGEVKALPSGAVNAASADDSALDASTGKVLEKARPVIEHMNAIAVSNGKEFLVGGSIDGSLHVWDIQRKRSTQWAGHYEKTEKVTVSINVVGFIHGAKGQACIVSGATDGRVRFWNMNGLMIWPQLEGIEVDYAQHTGEVQYIAISNNKSNWDGSLVATAGTDGRIVIWDVVWPENFTADPDIFDPCAVKPFEYQITGLRIVEAQGWPTVMLAWTESDRKSKLHTFDISAVRLEREGDNPARVFRRTKHKETIDEFVSAITDLTVIFEDIFGAEDECVLLVGELDGSLKPVIYSLDRHGVISRNRKGGTMKLNLGSAVRQLLPFREGNHQATLVLMENGIGVVSLLNGSLVLLQKITIDDFRFYTRRTFNVGDEGIMLAPDGKDEGRGLKVRVTKVEQEDEHVTDINNLIVTSDVKIYDKYECEVVEPKTTGKLWFDGHPVADHAHYAGRSYKDVPWYQLTRKPCTTSDGVERSWGSVHSKLELCKIHVPEGDNKCNIVVITDNQGRANVFRLNLSGQIKAHRNELRNMSNNRIDLTMVPEEFRQGDGSPKAGGMAKPKTTEVKSVDKKVAVGRERKETVAEKKMKAEKAVATTQSMKMEVIRMRSLRRVVLRNKRHQDFWESRYLADWSFIMSQFFDLNLTTKEHRRFISLNQRKENEEGARQKLRWIMLSLLSLPLRVPVEYVDKLHATQAENSKWKPVIKAKILDVTSPSSYATGATRSMRSPFARSPGSGFSADSNKTSPARSPLRQSLGKKKKKMQTKNPVSDLGAIGEAKQEKPPMKKQRSFTFENDGKLNVGKYNALDNKSPASANTVGLTPLHSPNNNVTESLMSPMSKHVRVPSTAGDDVDEEGCPTKSTQDTNLHISL